MLVSQDSAVGDKVMAKDALISSVRSRGDNLPGGVNRLYWLLLSELWVCWQHTRCVSVAVCTSTHTTQSK